MSDSNQTARPSPVPTAMPQTRRGRVVQGRYASLCRKWSQGEWKN